LKERQSNYPLIEIAGPIDSGKKHLSQMVASKIGAYVLNFPLFGADSYTANILLKTLTNNPEELEINPEWYIHLYVSHLYESKNLINNLLKEMPVVVTNYTGAFRVWSTCLNINMKQFMAGFTVNLPKPTRSYCINTKLFSDNLNIKLSSEFIRKYNKNILGTINKTAKSVIVEDSKFLRVQFNNALDVICSDLKKNFDLEINDMINFDSRFFAPKGVR